MKQRWEKFFLYAGTAIGLVIFSYAIIQTVKLKNTGLETKTLWDWMELLIIPTILAAGALALNRSEHKNDRQRAEERANLEREISIDRHQEAALQAYIDNMSDLLLKEKLRTSKNQEVRHVATIRTLTLLRGLDKTRKGLVLRFLIEAELVKQKYFFDLIAADLRNAELKGANLKGAALQGANLQGSNLSNANLNDITLRDANLQDTNLHGAYLVDADLQNTDLQGTHIQKANLQNANMRNTNLRNANLRNADLQGVDLQGADLQGADLQHANLYNANVRNTNIQYANVRYADLAEAIGGNDQLAFIESLRQSISDKDVA